MKERGSRKETGLVYKIEFEPTLRPLDVCRLEVIYITLRDVSFLALTLSDPDLNPAPTTVLHDTKIGFARY